MVRGCHLGRVLSRFWCNLKHKSIGICIERVQGMKRNGGGVTMPQKAVQFFSARNSPLVSPLLPFSLLFTVRALGIASRSPTKRCRRSGKSVKRGLTVKKFLQCALINARSIQCNMYIIQQLIVCHNLDVVAITESWLREDSGDDILRELCPAGYSTP